MLFLFYNWPSMSSASNRGGAHVRDREKKKSAPRLLLAGGTGRDVDGKSDKAMLPYSARTSAGSGALQFDCCRCGPGRLGHCMACRRIGRYGDQVAWRRAAWKVAK